MTVPGQDVSEAAVRDVLAQARELGMAPALCEVLADESAPARVRAWVLDQLLARLGGGS